MKSIKLVRLSLAGFKGNEGITSYSFGDSNEVIGDNGTGKTSIADAIAWAVTGKNFYGKSKMINLVNKHKESATAILEFHCNGVAHQIERTMKGSTNKVKLDGKAISQSKLEESICSADFLSIFNPLFFINLDKNEGYKKMESFINHEIKKEDILFRMKKEEAELIEDLILPSLAEVRIAKEREDLRAAEDQLKVFEGYKMKAMEPIHLPEKPLNQESIEKDLNEIQKKIKETLSQEDNSEDAIKTKEILEKIKKANNLLAEISKKEFSKQNELNEITIKGKSIKMEIDQKEKEVFSEFDASPYQSEINLIRDEYLKALDRVKRLKTKSETISNREIYFKRGDCCPTCKQKVQDDAIEKMRKELKEQVSKDISEIKTEIELETKSLNEIKIRGIEKKALLEKLIKSNEDKKTSFEKEKLAAIQKLKGECFKLKEAFLQLQKEENVFLESKKAEKEKIEAEISFLQKEFQALKEKGDNYKKIVTELRQKESELLKTKENFSKQQTIYKEAVSREEKRKAELKGFEEQEKLFTENISLIKARISALQTFMLTYVRMLNEIVSKGLNKVRIEIQKTVDDKIKPAFDIFYENKEIYICSTAEQIKAGIEVSTMLRELMGLDYPMFIDNAESITQIEIKEDIQHIISRVVKGSPLKLIQGA